MKVDKNTTRKNLIYQYVVLTILTVINVTTAEVNCNETPRFVHPSDCCPIPNIITDDIRETCKEFIKPRRRPPGAMRDENETTGPSNVNRRGHHHGPHQHCFISCVLNETGILVDNEFQENNLLSYLQNTTEDTKIIEVLSKNFMECSEEFKEMSENFEENLPPPVHDAGEHGPPNHPCPPHGKMLKNCAFSKTFTECPESIWVDTDECIAVRDYFIECKPRY